MIGVVPLYRSLLLLSVYMCASSELARLRLDGGRIITSSTLQWVHGSGRIPPHAIPVVENDATTVWCRAKQHGAYVGGSFRDGECTGSFLGQAIRVSDGYEILVSINGSARVKRFSWDKYSAPPHNSIASSEKQKNFLAVYLDKEGAPHAGFLVPYERRVHWVDDKGKVQRTDEALVLAEDEPETYDLRMISLGEEHKVVMKEEEVLKELTLNNLGSATQRIVELAEVSVHHLIYWGQIKGTYVGRSAYVISPKPESEARDVTWGVQNEFDKVHSKFVEYELPPGTATEVKVIGVIRKTEAPYIGTLTSIFSDGTHLSRVVEGLHMDERLILLKAVYSAPYFIHNNTQIQAKELTEILYSSSTTTTTTTTTSPTPRASMIGPKTPISDSLSSETERDTKKRVSSDCPRLTVIKAVPSALLSILSWVLWTHLY